MHKEIILNRQLARKLDRLATSEFSIPSIILMENAGRSIVDFIIKLSVQGKILICCGKGNNGGDGFVVARHLHNLNFSIHVLLFTNPAFLTGDAKINYDIATKSLIPITVITNENFTQFTNQLLQAEWVIDALFGTGFQGTLEDPYYQIIQRLNDANIKIISIDIPSGLDCDTGKPLNIAIQATNTLTFVGYKKGFLQPEAKKYLGQVTVLDIGLPRVLIEKGLRE